MDGNFILESNKLIADFMGVKIGIDKYSCRPGVIDPLREEYLAYHKEWGWLMPVVEKIEAIYDLHHGYFVVHISSNNCTIQGTNFRSDKISEPPIYFSDHYGETKIEATYDAIVSFIKWYINDKK